MFSNPGMIETTVIMAFGFIIWVFAMRGFLSEGKIEEDDTFVMDMVKKAQKQTVTPALMLTYITKEQILELTAEQVKAVPEAEVEKLPTAMKDMFKRRRNEVLLADKAKNNK